MSVRWGSFWKFEKFCWPEPHSARLGLTLVRQAKKKFCQGTQVLVTWGAVSGVFGRSREMFGSWRKLPDGAQPRPQEHHLKGQASSADF